MHGWGVYHEFRSNEAGLKKMMEPWERRFRQIISEETRLWRWNGDGRASFVNE